MPDPWDRFNPWAAAAALTVCLLAISAILGAAFPRWSEISLPLHSVLEGSGGTLALLMAAVSLRSNRDADDPTSLFLACGFAGMGILDIFHSVAAPGAGFVFLHTMAGLFGGVCFGMVWLTPFWRPRATWGFWAVVLGAIGLGAWTLAHPAGIPSMLIRDNFAPIAVASNLAAGVLFLAAAVFFLDRKSPPMVPLDRARALLALMFSIASLAFSESELWNAPWWYWHALRIGAYVIVFGLIGHRYAQMIDHLQAHGRSLEAEVDERTLELLREKLLVESVLNHAPVAIALFDPDGVCKMANEVFAGFAGAKRESFLNKPIFEALPHLQGVLTESLETAVTTGLKGIQHDLAWPGVGERGPGASYWSFRYEPIFQEDQTLLGILVLGIDISDRVERERLQGQQIERLKALDRLRREFVDAISHDLRTPLASVKGFTEFLEDELAGPLTGGQRDFIKQVQLGILRMERLVDDLLDYARIEAGTFRLHCEPADLAKVVRDIAESFRPHVVTARISLAISLPPVLPVTMDSQRIGQVVANLVQNSLKFTPSGGSIRLTLSQAEGQAHCEVEDTGVGIAYENLPKLFVRFSQLKDGVPKGGAGLGLSISKAIVEAHGGEIGVRSKPGKGSTFWFSLPLSQSHQETPLRPPERMDAG